MKKEKVEFIAFRAYNNIIGTHTRFVVIPKKQYDAAIKRDPNLKDLEIWKLVRIK